MPFLVIMLLLGTSCMDREQKDFQKISINDHVLTVEIADNPEKREKGLMHRKQLDKDWGMLFVFEKEEKVSFWMKNTSIALSLAYISKDGIIREVHDLHPFSEKAVHSSRSVLYALEVNQGYFKEKGIGPGDKIHFSF